MKTDILTRTRAQIAGMEAAKPLLERVDAIDERLAELAAELKTFHRLLPKSDISALMLGWLQRERTQFEGESSEVFLNTLMRTVAALHRGDRPRVWDGQHGFQLLLSLLWPQIEQSVPLAIERLNYQEGPSAVERARRGPAIEVEHAALLTEREQLVDEIAAVTNGAVKLDHLPETAERRSRDAEDRRRDAAFEASHGRVLDRINTRHEQERGGAPVLD